MLRDVGKLQYKKMGKIDKKGNSYPIGRKNVVH